MIKFSIQKNRGFTLVEAMVAISIFTVSILASMAVLTNSIQNTKYAKEKVTAEYLAQEGIEYARNMRDTYMLYYPPDATTGWNKFATNVTAANCNASNGCYFGDLSSSDFNNSNMPITGITMSSCSTSSTSVCSNHPLLYNAANGTYGYTSGVNSGYARAIKITFNGNQANISSTVSWLQGSGLNKVTFSETLSAWITQ